MRKTLFIFIVGLIGLSAEAQFQKNAMTTNLVPPVATAAANGLESSNQFKNMVLQGSNLFQGLTYTNDATLGQPSRGVTVVANMPYYVNMPNDGTNEGLMTDYPNDSTTNDISPPYDGIWYPATTSVYAFSGAGQLGKVNITLIPAFTNVAGLFGGQFDGTLTAASIVPLASLPNTVVRNNSGYDNDSTAAGYAGDLTLNNTSTTENFLAVAKTSDGSSLQIVKYGTNIQYADIGFWAFKQTTLPVLSSLPTTGLMFAIGCAVPGVAGGAFPYNDPYWECYSSHNMWFVGPASGPAIYGGVNGTNGNLTWYSGKTSENDESTKMFEVLRSSNFVFASSIVIGASTNTPSFTYSNNLTFVIGTLYTNTTGRPIHVSSAANLTIGATSGQPVVELKSGSIIVNESGVVTTVNTQVGTLYFTVAGDIKAGDTFQWVYAGSGTGSSAILIGNTGTEMVY